MLDAFSMVLDRVMVRRLVKQLVLMDNWKGSFAMLSNAYDAFLKPDAFAMYV
jgi:hypothetical protein